MANPHQNNQDPNRQEHSHPHHAPTANNPTPQQLQPQPQSQSQPPTRQTGWICCTCRTPNVSPLTIHTICQHCTHALWSQNQLCTHFTPKPLYPTQHDRNTSPAQPRHTLHHLPPRPAPPTRPKSLAMLHMRTLQRRMDRPHGGRRAT